MMTNNHIKQSFESITPTEEQKKRMLNNILQKAGEQPIEQLEPKVIPLSRKTRPFLAIAASLVIVVSGAITLTQVGDDNVGYSPMIPNENQDTTHLIVYNNTSYTYGEELTDISPEDLIGPLDTIENSGDDADIIWQLKGHDPKDTIVLEHLGTYYLCKKLN